MVTRSFPIPAFRVPPHRNLKRSTFCAMLEKSQIFRLPLRREAGERVGERWCSGNRGAKHVFYKTHKITKRTHFPFSASFCAIKHLRSNRLLSERKTNPFKAIYQPQFFFEFHTNHRHYARSLGFRWGETPSSPD